MGIFSWDESYSVMIPEFDKHHQTLLKLLQNLHDNMMKGQAKNVIEDIFKELSNYVNYHFQAEERKMRMYRYPDLTKHIETHNAFKRKLKELIDEYKTGNLKVTGETYSFLKNWLVNHIQKVDKDYATFFHDNGFA